MKFFVIGKANVLLKEVINLIFMFRWLEATILYFHQTILCSFWIIKVQIYILVKFLSSFRFSQWKRSSSDSKQPPDFGICISSNNLPYHCISCWEYFKFRLFLLSTCWWQQLFWSISWLPWCLTPTKEFRFQLIYELLFDSLFLATIWHGVEVW